MLHGIPAPLFVPAALPACLPALALPDPARPDPAAAIQAWLMQGAAAPEYGVSIALAGVLAGRRAQLGPAWQPLYGVSSEELERLCLTHFPGVPAISLWQPGSLPEPADCAEALELQDLLELLLAHRSVSDEGSRWLAHAMATACLGADHLWQDLRLTSRAVLRELFEGFFYSLALRNRADMKWKKFLYRQLCEQAQIRVCKSPSCGMCSDYKACFGPED